MSVLSMIFTDKYKINLWAYKCSRLVSDSHTFQDSKKSYFINYEFDCDFTGVIYLLSCKKCKKFYIGSTTVSFRRRFNSQQGSIPSRKVLELHFSQVVPVWVL